MLVYRTFEELKAFLDKQVGLGLSIGFVPTMGALHEGHMSLIKESNSLADITVCSVFVNPTQFNVAEDLEKYPRTEERDVEMLGLHNCDVVFVPTVHEVYPENYKTSAVNLGGIELVMEGKHRLGHFEGVVQVVGRFFEQINPNFAFFGEKDFQQLAVIKKMVIERGFDVNIIPCAIKREVSGLAMSSRNLRLSVQGIEIAKEISVQLNWVKSVYATKNIRDIEKEITQYFKSHSKYEFEYFEIANETTLQPIVNFTEKARAFIAVELEGVRLIDNMVLN